MKVTSDLSVTSAPRRARHGWHPGWLFGDGAKGGWYDPSDLSSLFQDAAGTVPVTAPGSPVGRMQDRSGTLVHATQSGFARPTYCMTPASGHRNLATISEPVASELVLSTGVTDAGMAGFAHAIAVPGGSVGNRFAYFGGDLDPMTEYSLSCYIAMEDGEAPVLGTDFNVVIGNTSGGAGWGAPVEVSPGVWRVSRTLTSASTNLQNTGVVKTNGHSTRGFLVAGFQVESGASMTTYQRACSAFDLREDGVASLAALDFDGVDDRLLSGTLDLTHTSQVTVVAGVTKHSNPASRGTVVNFVDNGFRNFGLEVPQPTTATTRWLHAGATTLRSVGAPLNLDTRAVYTGLSDLDAPRIELRENGVSVGADSSITGGGPFKSGPLGIGDYVTPTGRRFHGRIFGLLVIDRLLGAGEIARVEGWFRTKTGVTQ